MRNKNGYGLVETAIVLIVIGVLVIIVMDRYEKTIYEAKRSALKAELGGLNQSVSLYKTIKGRYPESLKELLDIKYVLPYKNSIISGKYLEAYSLDSNKNIIDPFGKPYLYDKKTGSVSPASRINGGF